MNKLFFFDIDGTLVECNQGVYSIPNSTREALKRLQQQGDKVFLATGRCKCFILDGVMDYPFDGYVTCNGAYVEYEGSEIYKKVIPVEAIRMTDELCKRLNLSYYFEGNEYIYVLDKNDSKHISFKNMWGMKDKVIVDQYDPEKIETYIGMIVVNNKDDIKEMVDVLSPYFDIQKHQSGYSFDLTLKGESKAKGIKKLTQAVGNKMENTIAYGDGRNDIEMLSEVGIGIAMGNAAVEAKEVADYITDDVMNDGILKALYHFKLYR